MTPRLMVEMHENMAAIVRHTVLKLASWLAAVLLACFKDLAALIEPTALLLNF
jgi:hypothetical protein